MKMKELKNLAQKIAKQERILQSPDCSSEDKAKAEQEIMKLSSKVQGFDDIMVIDELVQEILEKKS